MRYAYLQGMVVRCVIPVAIVAMSWFNDIPVLQICNARMTRPFFLYERGGTPTTLDLSNVAIWLLTNLFVLKHCCLNFQNVLVPFQISGVGGRA